MKTKGILKLTGVVTLLVTVSTVTSIAAASMSGDLTSRDVFPLDIRSFSMPSDTPAKEALPTSIAPDIDTSAALLQINKTLADTIISDAQIDRTRSPGLGMSVSERRSIQNAIVSLYGNQPDFVHGFRPLPEGSGEEEFNVVRPDDFRERVRENVTEERENYRDQLRSQFREEREQIRDTGGNTSEGTGSEIAGPGQ